MRFSFRRPPRWIDTLDWTPERPFGWEPQAQANTARPGNDDIGWNQPRAEAPKPAPQPDVAPDPPPAANLNRAPSWLAPRLAIGLAQGLGLFLLIQARAHGLWPGSDPWLFAALSLAGLFAPLLVLEGLGDIALPALLLWSAIAAAILASLGLYHHWRIQGQDQGYAGLALAATTAVMLTIAQCLLRAGLRDRKLLAAYPTYFDTAWTLAARLFIWAVVTGTAWALLGSGNSLFNWLRAHDPGFRPHFDPALLILPLMGLASAAAFDMTSARSWSRRFVRKAALACFTLALPLLILAAAALLVRHLLALPVSLAMALGCAALLLAALNASYRGEPNRGGWRKASEFIASFLLPALVAVAALALAARINALGWTAVRVYAAAVLALLALYGLGAGGAALISIGGGRWMQRLEVVNPALALLVIAACLALSSPLADPLKLAVTAQQARLNKGADPTSFDFAWLRRDGGRFGAAALADLAAAPEPDIARAAAVTLSAAPGSDAPPPTQIGANITVRTPGARLPDALLHQDWAALGEGVPPCLTKPALACDAWFLDLDHDGAREILLVYGNDTRWWASVLKLADGAWRPAASFASPRCHGLLTALREGRFSDVDPLPGWRDLLVAGLRITAKPTPPADLPCPSSN